VKEPNWIERDDCLAYHDALLSRFGGAEGIRDMNGLESALARPKNLLAYGKPSPFELSAAYAYGIASNHPFIDGNKRTAFMTAALFLEINGWVFQATEEDAVLHTLALAAGELSEAEYATWMEESSEARRKK
jgi:death-on-curing protein